MNDAHRFEEEHKIWDRIPGEPDKAFRAFECFLDMPYWERKDLHAYRTYTGNSIASHVSASWLSWKEEFLWEERARTYDYHVQKERREQIIHAQVEAGYERGDEMAQMEQRMFHVQEMLYEKLREKLEEDDLSQWRPMDLINLSRVMIEAYSAVQKARQTENRDPWEDYWSEMTNEEREQALALATWEEVTEVEASVPLPPEEDHP